MPRPRMRRHVRFRPTQTFFKPQGVPMRHLGIETLSAEEIEAMRLKHVEQLGQEACAQKMKTSQSTFQRILASAHKKVTKALTQGRAIRIEDDRPESAGSWHPGQGR